MNPRNRFFAVLMCAALLAALLASSVIAPGFAGHSHDNCDPEDCPLCQIVTRAQEQNKLMLFALSALAATLFAVKKMARRASADEKRLSAGTLTQLKVRLNN